MTPLAVSIWQRPLLPEKRQQLGDLLAECQFFDCNALIPLVAARISMPDSRMATIELLQAELPAERTWIEFGQKAVIISNAKAALDPVLGSKLRIIVLDKNEGPVVSAHVMPDGSLDRILRAESASDEDKLKELTTIAVRSAWFAIEAMQTPNGLCHQIEHNPTRQLRRAAQRTSTPCHKWVEIKLGRGRKTSSPRRAETSGKTVAWHYRRGHRVEHPNPNYPKWRKGCWVGDADAGIRTHNYIVEVPE